MKLLTDLVWKCYKNDLAIDIAPKNYGSVTVWDHLENEAVNVTEGYLKNWKWETPEDALNRMHKEVDAYLDKEYIQTSEESNTVVDEFGETDEYYEEARARLTEYERKMKEAGHKESDFR